MNTIDEIVKLIKTTSLPIPQLTIGNKHTFKMASMELPYYYINIVQKLLRLGYHQKNRSLRVIYGKEWDREYRLVQQRQIKYMCLMIKTIKDEEWTLNILLDEMNDNIESPIYFLNKRSDNININENNIERKSLLRAITDIVNKIN